MHRAFPHNILKQKKENGAPSFSGTGGCEEYNLSLLPARPPLFPLPLSPCLVSLWIFGPTPRGTAGSAGRGGGTASAGPRRRGTDTARTHSYGLAVSLPHGPKILAQAIKIAKAGGYSPPASFSFMQSST